jgi:hypothetical protein
MKGSVQQTWNRGRKSRKRAGGREDAHQGNYFYLDIFLLVLNPDTKKRQKLNFFLILKKKTSGNNTSQ